jgi:hypothetical protein
MLITVLHVIIAFNFQQLSLRLPIAIGFKKR